MTEKYLIRFEVNVIDPKANTLSVRRKKGISTINSELDDEELMARKDEASDMIAMDLTSQGIMLFDKPEIKSIKLKKERKPKRIRNSKS